MSHHKLYPQFMSVIQDEVFIKSALYKILVTEQQAGEFNKDQRNNATHIQKTPQFSGRKKQIIHQPLSSSFMMHNWNK